MLAESNIQIEHRRDTDDGRQAMGKELRHVQMSR